MTRSVYIKSKNSGGKPGKTYYVFNQTRESFLSLNVTLTDTHVGRLKGLLGKLRLKGDEGIWIVPSQGVHTIGVLFAVDLIYLDRDNRVIHLEESFGPFRIGPVRTAGASVLELPTRTIYSSHTQVGDQLLICSPEAMEEFFGQEQWSALQAHGGRGDASEIG
jgi:uncharacterized protein